MNTEETVMYATFKAIGTAPWTITDEGLEYRGEKFRFDEITSVRLQNNTSSSLINGVIQVVARGKMLILGFPFKQKAAAEQALQILQDSYGTGEQQAANAARREMQAVGLVYDLKGVRGRSMRVYEDRAVIKTEAGLGSFLTGNVSDGEKTIYYVDCIGVQFKESGIQIGYLQLETASALMNNKQSNFFNENSFTFDASVLSNEKMREVADYVRARVASAKQQRNQPVAAPAPVSAAEEIKKFKELLDIGAITQEEYDAKKKQLLGL